MIKILNERKDKLKGNLLTSLNNHIISSNALPTRRDQRLRQTLNAQRESQLSLMQQARIDQRVQSTFISKRDSHVKQPSKQKQASLDQNELQIIENINITSKTLKWAKVSLSHYFVQKKSLYFILDSSFEHYWQYDKCVNFICDAFVDLSNLDLFGLMNLGDESHNILLEEKACNSSVKKLILNSLKKSIEDSHFQRRQIDFKKALDQAI